MSDCDEATSVPDWLIEHPETFAVIRELGIDYTCGGKSLESACRERGLDVQWVVKSLRRAAAGDDGTDAALRS